jgi:hypothetical protein
MPSPAERGQQHGRAGAAGHLLQARPRHVRLQGPRRDKKRSDEYDAAKDAYSEKHPNRSGDLSPDDKKFMDPLITKMADCIHRIRGDK